MDINSSSQYKDYSKLSRYQAFPIYFNSKDNKFSSGITGWLSEDTPFVLHNVKQNDDLSILSLYYYNNPNYFWIIADFNRMNDPFEKLAIGSKIKIPTFSEIKYEN